MPYSILFGASGWKIHYVICGRKNAKITHGMKNKRFNKGVDKTIKQVKDKKVLFIENNSYNGATSVRIRNELKKSFNIKKPDLFLDYFVDCKKYPEMKKFPRNIFLKYNKKLQNKFGKIYVADSLKVSKKEHDKLIAEFLKKLR